MKIDKKRKLIIGLTVFLVVFLLGFIFNPLKVNALELEGLFTSTIQLKEVDFTEMSVEFEIVIKTDDTKNYDAVEDNAKNKDTGFYIEISRKEGFPYASTIRRYITEKINIEEKENEFLKTIDVKYFWGETTYYARIGVQEDWSPDEHIISNYVSFETPDTGITTAGLGGLCEITSMEFDIPGYNPTSGGVWKMQTVESWYDDDDPPPVKVNIKTKKCGGETIDVSIVEEDTVWEGDIAPIDDAIDQLDNYEIEITSDDVDAQGHTNITIDLKAGETDCEKKNDPNCKYYIEVARVIPGAIDTKWNSDGKPKGNLEYNCDQECKKKWQRDKVMKGPIGVIFMESTARHNSATINAEIWTADPNKKVCGKIRYKKEDEGAKDTPYIDYTTNDKGSVFYTHDLTGLELVTDYSFQIIARLTDSGKKAKSKVITFTTTAREGEVNVIGAAVEGAPTKDWYFFNESTDKYCKCGPHDTKLDCQKKHQKELEKKEGYCVRTYKLLEPLPGVGEYVEPRRGLGDYLNKIFMLIIGIAGVLAVVMIVLGGIRYMMSEVVFEKEAAKKQIGGAIWGLLLALGSFMILNTINPDILNLELGIKEVEITMEDLFSETEDLVSKIPGYEMKGKFTEPEPGLAVSSLISEYLENGWELYKITIDADPNNNKNGKVKFHAKKGNKRASGTANAIGTGKHGTVADKDAKKNDKKTPLGTYKIYEIRKSTSTSKAEVSKDGYNMGAAFYGISAKIKGEYRGIGLHGNASSKPWPTGGCIRMSNDDLVALMPYMETGIEVVIQ